MAAHFDIIAHVATLPKTSPVLIRVFNEFLQREAHVRETADTLEAIRRISIERFLLEQRAWNSYRGINH